MERRRLECVSNTSYHRHFSDNSNDCRLHRFLLRLARHPTLQRSTLVRAFFESTEWVRPSACVLDHPTEFCIESTYTCISMLPTRLPVNIRKVS